MYGGVKFRLKGALAADIANTTGQLRVILRLGPCGIVVPVGYLKQQLALTAALCVQIQHHRRRYQLVRKT